LAAKSGQPDRRCRRGTGRDRCWWNDQWRESETGDGDKSPVNEARRRDRVSTGEHNDWSFPFGEMAVRVFIAWAFLAKVRVRPSAVLLAPSGAV